MPPTNYDASELIRRRQAATLAGYSAALETYRNTVNINSSRSEQPRFEVLSVVTQRKMGGCYCSDINFYRRNVGATCGTC